MIANLYFSKHVWVLTALAACFAIAASNNVAAKVLMNNLEGGGGGGGSYNHVPAVPQAVFPINGKRSVPRVPTLRCIASDPDVGDALTFEIKLGTSPTDLETISPPGMTECTLPVPERLIRYEDYFWQVVVRDNHGAATAGPVWTFRTQALFQSALFGVVMN